jgi:hypothetical protein
MKIKFLTFLQVPLDYSDPSVGNAALAVIRLAANSSADDYRGRILFNPGGPGRSGVDTLVASGPSFEVIFGSKQYDLVSFDPRGEFPQSYPARFELVFRGKLLHPHSSGISPRCLSR